MDGSLETGGGDASVFNRVAKEVTNDFPRVPRRTM